MTKARRLRFWEKAAPTLRVAGAIVLAAGMIHLYAEVVIFDARAFGARAASSLGDPRVAGFVAERITDEAVAQRRDLMAYRPLLVGTARTIVSSEAFRAGFRRAAQGAHAALFSQSAERLALSVPDLGVLVRSALVHDPALAARIPASLRAGVSVGPSGRVAKALVQLVRLGHRFRRNAFVAVGLGVLLLLLGIAMPRDRRRALLNGGAALASVALVLFFLPPLARTALTASMSSPELRPVVAGVWDAFAGGLRLWALVLAGIGIVLGSAASSYASHVEIDEVGRRVWRRLREPARTWQGEILRAVLLTGLGLLAAFRPTATLQGLMVVAGALLAFEGLRELFLLVPPRLREAASHAEEALADAQDKVARGEGLRMLARHALVGLVAVGLIAGAVFFMRSPAALPEAPAFTDACNGDRALCDRRLDQVVFPGAHNSMSAAEFDGWMFPNQELGSVSLLGHGIRALLFDVHYGTPIGERVKTEILDEKASRATFEAAIGKEAVDAAMRIRDRLTGPPTGPRAPYLCHGFCELGAVPLVTMLEGVRDFLVRNPGEVLVFVIEDYVDPGDIEASFRASGLERFVYRGGVSAPFPTLREMIDSDQRLVVFGEKDARGVPWYHPAFETIQETPYRFLTPEELSCRPNRGGAGAPLFQVNHWIETTPTPRPSNAAIVNAHDFLLARARKCQEERGKLPNILAVDFAMTGDVVGVAAVLNGLSSRGAPSESTPRKDDPVTRHFSLLLALLLAVPAATAAEGDWVSLFDGKTLAGWKAAESSASFRVADGAIACDGPRAHLFYVGADGNAAFENFEVVAEVKARAGANSGFYFHTAFQEKDWPGQGFEVQVNNSQRPHGDYLELKMTGSLYGIRNVYKALAKDDEWFTLHVTVRKPRVEVRVNDTLVVDWIEPPSPLPEGAPKLNRLGRGTFALQCHDPESKVFFRNVRVRPLPAPPAVASPVPPVDARYAQMLALGRANFPLVDLHAHLKGGLTLEQALALSRGTGMFLGLAVNCGKGFPVETDEGALAYLKTMEGQPAFVAMQAEGREWVTMFSKETRAKFDYVFTDGMTWTNPAGKRMRLWIPEEVEIGPDEGAFMDLLVSKIVGILETEPIDVYVNATFLPAAIAPRYDALWTEERMTRVIDAAVKKGVAIEIGARYKIPSERFLRLAKARGAKFTFGTNNAGANDLGDWSYPLEMQKKLDLKWQDMFVPGHQPSRAQRE